LNTLALAGNIGWYSVAWVETERSWRSYALRKQDGKRGEMLEANQPPQARICCGDDDNEGSAGGKVDVGSH